MNGDEPTTLDKPELYRITVQGQLQQDTALLGSMRFSLDEMHGDTTTLVGTVDQAELQGMLRGLYYLGFPIISVIRGR